ncbi:hypothetical protein FOMPIDRAFT_93318 [Fomitopsis schrenkii]|uniref:Uncharacterized protein n=1 Tax=Fomitopsis schrenkii TaxID=2126942 RepID=S8EB44_FOMSC|nr:hypothetical protein FOMPIDRAFT_93318 [Fomitopsis schrenkii]
MSPPFTLGGPCIVSPDEDNYQGSNYMFNNYTKESPLGQLNYNNNDEDIDVLLSSSPTDGGRTFSSVNHTQQTQFEFGSSPPPDDTSDGSLQHLIEHIKAWKLSKDVFGTLLKEQEFLILEDWEEICKIDEDQWEDVQAFIDKETSILRYFSFHYMLSCQELHVGSPSANHKAGINAQSEAFQDTINLCEPHQKFCQDCNCSLVTRYARSNVPDGIVGVHLRYTVIDSLEREHGVISIWQDLTVFEMASSKTTESLMSTIVCLSQRRKSLIEQHQAVVEADSAIAATGVSAAAAAAAEAEAVEAEAGTDKTDTRAADTMAVVEVAAAAATEAAAAANAAACAVERSRHRGQGPRLWGCLKYVFEDLIPPGPGQQPQEDGLCEGGGPAIDVLSQGWIRKGVVLAKHIKAFWFTFNAADSDAVGKLIKTCTTPAEWVRAGYAVPLLHTYEWEELKKNAPISGLTVDEILDARTKVLQRWVNSVQDGRTLAIHQLSECVVCLHMRLQHVQSIYPVVPSNNPLCQGCQLKWI